MFVISRLSSRTDLRKFRFRLVVLPVKRWLALALWCLIFPLPVTFNLLAAPRLLFNFNILYYPLYEKTLSFTYPLSAKQKVTKKPSLLPKPDISVVFVQLRKKLNSLAPES
jgi:hypothetical protein